MAQQYMHVMRTLITTTSMSKHLHPLQLAIEDSRNLGLWGNTYRKPSQPEFDGYLTHSSSPARSSSPPSTPYSSRRDPGYAYIRSSPDVAVDPLYRQRGVGYWGRPALSSKSLFSSPCASGSTVYDHHYSSSHGLQEDSYSHFLDSDGPRNDLPSDSEEDIEDISHVRSDDSTYRTTFFRVSAERGLWRSEPMPLTKATPSIVQERKSVPTFSRVPTPLPLSIRTVSEPAPSNNSQMTGFYPEKEDEPVAELLLVDTGEQPTRFTPSLDSKLEEVSSPHTLPSLIVDAESSEGDTSIELDEPGVPSSPLPPSSPPLSPLSRSISIMSRSSSPLSFAYEGSSSPLSELPDDYDNDDSDVEEQFTLNNSLGMQIIEQTVIPSLNTEDDTKDPEHESEMQTSCRNLAQREHDSSPPKPRLSPLSCLDDPLAFSPSPVPIISNVKIATLSREDITLDSDDTFSSTFGSTAATSSSFLRCVLGEERVDYADVEMIPNLPDPVPSTAKVDEDSKDRSPSPNMEKPSALKDKNGVMHRSSNIIQPSTSRGSSQKAREREGKRYNSEEKQNDVEGDGVKSSDAKVKKVNGRKRMAHDDEEDVENDGSSSGGSKHKRLKRMDGDNVAPRSTKRVPKPRRRSTCPPSTSETEEPLDAETRELHATICGLVIETMATSRASSLPTTSIFKLVMNSQPSLKSQRSEQDWLRIFQRVLRDGAAERGSGVFGKVESSGKDASDRPLEAQWFYVPERDEDQERAALIRSMMPRPGKRTETMKYKQYYWRPLEKISKWDPEDAL